MYFSGLVTFKHFSNFYKIFIVTAARNEASTSDCNTSAVAGSVVVVLLSVIVIVTGVVLVTYLVLRHKRRGKM